MQRESNIKKCTNIIHFLHRLKENTTSELCEGKQRLLKLNNIPDKT